MRMDAVQNAYVQLVRFWWVKAACGGGCERGVKVLGGVEVPEQVRDCAGVGWVKPTGVRRVGGSRPTVSKLSAKTNFRAEVVEAFQST